MVSAPFETDGGHSKPTTAAPQPWWGRHGVPVFVAVLLLGIAIVITAATERFLVDQRISYRRETVRESLVSLRARLDAALTANLLVGQGMAAFVAANPDLSDDDFYAMARNLLSHRSQVLNIALAKGTEVTHVYPLNGNSAILGMNYRLIPDQWPSVEDVIVQGHAVINGPVRRVQGGIAIIARFPVHVSARRGQGARYWGLVSLPIDLSALLTKAGAVTPMVVGGIGSDHHSGLMLDVAIRGRDGNGAGGGAFFGQPEVFERAPEMLDLLLPTGSWQLAAIPVEGWAPGTADIWTLRGGGVFFGLIFAAMGYLASWYILKLRLQRSENSRYVIGNSSLHTLLPTPAFLEAAEVEMATSLRYRRAVGFLVIAVDHFKDHSAQWSKAQKAEILAAVTQACRNALRPTDLLTSMAEGEFAALLIGANRDGAIMAADRVRRAIKAITIPWAQGEETAGIGILTASIGASVVRDGDPDAASALNRAAERLQSWQSNGGDGVAL